MPSFGKNRFVVSEKKSDKQTDTMRTCCYDLSPDYLQFLVFDTTTQTLVILVAIILLGVSSTPGWEFLILGLIYPDGTGSSRWYMPNRVIPSECYC